jgi:hypothetical protein
MVKFERGESGKFAPKSNEPRIVRSIRLTDTTWKILGEIADSRGITRADLIEHLIKEGVISSDSLTSPTDSHSYFLAHIEDAFEKILEDPSVTRSGKDKGAVRRGLLALLKSLSP